MKKQTICFVKDDVSGLRMLDRQYFMQMLSDFGAGTKLKLSVEHYHPQRSLKQNNAFYLWVDLLAEELSIEPERLKELLKYKFTRRPLLDKKGEEVIDESTGEVEWYVPSTADLDKKEFAEFMDKIHLWAIEFANYELPALSENYKLNFQEEHKQQLKEK